MENPMEEKKGECRNVSVNTVIIISVVIALVVSLLMSFLLNGNSAKKDSNELISDFYATETAVLVSPHHLRKAMMKGDTSDFVLVDVRSQEEYEREHIIGAINIPAYKDPNTSAYGDVERIVKSFSELDQDKDIILYCYSIPCMTGRKVGKMLAENGVYVKELGVGWNEWRYYWNLWNHEHEWENTNVMEYVSTGSEPGVFSGDAGAIEPCAIDNEFGC